jgi:ABC-type sugar transport system ATPase subunit
MNNGRIQQLAPPKEVYRHPANRFVAGFIGSPSMNLLIGSIKGNNFHSNFEDIGIRLPNSLAADVTTDPLTLGVRPENVQIVDTPDEYTFEATVDVVELIGSAQVIHITSDKVEFLAEVDPDYEVSTGDSLLFRLPPKKINLFDGINPESPLVEPVSEKTSSVGSQISPE